jgi:predicted nucleotidyltransferase
VDTTIDIIKYCLSSLRKYKIFVEKAYLFGSYAKKKYDQNSDIDLALILKSLPDDKKFDTQVQLLLIASEFDTRIEPHPFSSKDFNYSNPFASEILKTGFEIKLDR